VILGFFQEMMAYKPVFHACNAILDSFFYAYSAIVNSEVKSALRKLRLREGKDRDCALLMSDVSVLCKSCVVHLTKWTTLFAEFKCFE